MASTLRQTLRKLSDRWMPGGPSSATIPFVEYGKKFYFSHFTPDFPRDVEIQTQYGCNARCVFCPMGREDNVMKGRMSDEVFQRVVDECVEHGVWRFGLHLQNDPLIDREMPQRIKYIIERRGKKKFPHVKIITNGGMLTDEMSAGLIESGLDNIVFSVHGIDAEIYNSIMNGPKFDKVIPKIERFMEIKKELKAQTPKVEVWCVRTKDVEPQVEEATKFWEERGIYFKARKMDNRANPDLVDESLAPEEGEWRYADQCSIPFWRAWILWNGDLVLCCVDWERTKVFGNITNQSIYEVWNSPAYQEVRERFKKKDFAGLLCENCKGI